MSVALTIEKDRDEASSALRQCVAEVLAIVCEGYGEMPPIGRSTASDEDVARIVAYPQSMK